MRLRFHSVCPGWADCVHVIGLGADSSDQAPILLRSSEVLLQRQFKTSSLCSATREKDSTMIRWLIIGSFACLLIGTTGCLHHNTRCNSGGCNTGSCNSGSCGDSGGCNSCSTGKCGGGGISGACSKVAGICGLCKGRGGCRNGCIPGPVGWQQGGHDYSGHLNAGLLGHTAGQAMQGVGQGPGGAPTAQVAYPYYTVRGPRDFLLDNPPTIGR